MAKKTKIRIYNLARELKQSPQLIIEEIRKLGNNVSVASNAVSDEIAQLIRNKYSSKGKSVVFGKVKILKSLENLRKNQDSLQKKSSPIFDKEKTYINCEFCKILILSTHYENHINQKCPQRINLEALTKQDIITERIIWTLLPKGVWLFSSLKKHFNKLSKNSKWKQKTFDETRFQKIEKLLNPCKCYIGNAEFEGYVVYCFNWTSSVIL